VTLPFRRFILRVLSEPLTHFLIAGLVLYLANRIQQRENDAHRIVITPTHAAQLAKDYALQFGTTPDAPTLDGLIERDIHDEILYRQGHALKLDADDLIVRRRVAQKMEFLLQDLSAPPEPTDSQLQAYYQAHAVHYARPPRTTFSHIYFSSDARGEATARARAAAVLPTLPNQSGRAPERGDPFPDLYDFASYEPDQIERLFGRTPFAAAVQTVPVGRWAGPFKSGYGWHLLYVNARQDSARPPLAEIRDSVRADFLREAQETANKAAFDALAHTYQVVREDRSARP
jgi:peptidyl-prolyl cis-trans isomerase C